MEMFPDAPLWSEAFVEKRRSNAQRLWEQGAYDGEEYRAAVSDGLKHYYQTDDGIENRQVKSETMRDHVGSWWDDPDNVEWFKERRSEYMREVMSDPERREAVGKMFSELWQDEEYRQRCMKFKQSDSNREFMSDFMKEWWAENKECEMEKRSLDMRNGHETDIETILYSILDHMNISYQKQVPIDGYVVDALVNNWLVLEAYGDYWHNYPNGKERDKVRNNRLNDLGYWVVPFWGHELKESPQQCANKITYIVECT